MDSKTDVDRAPVDAVVSRMRLFVWEDCLTDYTSGIMFAVAETVEQARAKLLEKCSYIPAGELNCEPDVYDMSESVGFVVWGGG